MAKLTCAQCGRALPAMRHQGSPRRWCSERCRLRAYRGLPASSQHPCADCGEQTERRSVRCESCAAEAQRTRARTRARALASQREPAAPDLRSCDECGGMYETTRYQQRYCSGECRDRRRYRLGSGRTNTTTRGYGREHVKVRDRWRPIVERGEATCCLCGEPIQPFDLWHLDHTPERDGYRGVAHARCNMRDGGKRGGEVTARGWVSRRAAS